MSAVQDRFFTLLGNKLAVDEAVLTPQATLDDLDLDSLLLIELSVAVEKEFGVVLDETELAPQTTLESVLGRIEGRSKVAS